MTSFPILSNKEKKELIQLANEAADCAREAILPYFRKNIDVSNKDKEAFAPVTEADKAGEDAIRQVISFYRPDDGIWGKIWYHNTNKSTSFISGNSRKVNLTAYQKSIVDQAYPYYQKLDIFRRKFLKLDI